jgi:hypothetical protein
MSNELNSDTITFGKYKNGTLKQVLRDRSYCTWLLKQEWFQSNYGYLHNRVQEYEPLHFFFQKPPDDGESFLERYQYFHLTPLDNVELPLSDDEKKCYAYYLRMVGELKTKIEDLLDTDNPYDIKAPCRWLLRFEKENELKRAVFKEFINAHELKNITTLVERIKKEGGIEYLGAQSFNIAKKRSLEQEAFWEKILKEKYGEDLSTQFKFSSCIFDFIHIPKNLIFEAKLNLKDFHLEQYEKYKKALEKYRIIYLIGKDAVIIMEEQVIYTTDIDKYTTYQFGILASKYTGKFDLEIRDYIIVHVDDLSTLFET